MCIGNRASTSVYYINKQLEALWKISTDCVAKHGYGIKAGKTEVEYGSSLAQLCVGKHNRIKPCTEDLSFFAAFGAPPQLKFICNHEAVLVLQLKTGHFKLEGKGGIEFFENYTCSFRVQFHEHLITDTSYSKFGQTEACKTKLLILDLGSATFLREHSQFADCQKFGSQEIDRKHKYIVKYLSSHYLPLLRKAGFHCIHSLPDFDNLSRSHHIDYSLVSEVEIEVFDIFGINIDVVNTFLKSRWLEAAACVDELEHGHDHSAFGDFALAEHRGVCDDTHFHAFFGPPQIRALCSNEVVFYIDIQDLHFYLGGGFHTEPHHLVSDWKIAVVVGIHFVEEEEGCIRRLRLDFSKSRFCESRSVCRSETIEETLLIKLRNAFTQYITQRYLVILEEFHHHHVYHHDVRVLEIEEDFDYSEDDEIVESSSEFRERLCITDTFGFDIITTITQGSINNHLRCLWKASRSVGGCLARWALEAFFGGSFGAPQIQFLCDSSSNTVILYIDLREGFLTSLGPSKKCIGGERHSFSSWKLAFEITLKHREYTKPHSISQGCLKGHGGDEFILNQLVLDFSTAKFRQDLSHLSGLFDGSNCRLMRSKREALLYYITYHYFAELKKEGHHVLYTIPTRKPAGTHGVIKYAAASFAFQFYPAPFGEGGDVVSCLFGRQRTFGDRNMLVMCGMLDRSKRPSFPLPRCSWQWGSDQEAFAGTFALSRKVFLDGWLLRELTRINARTTLVPIFPGSSDGDEWNFQLVRWEEHPCNNSRSCDWREIGYCEEGLEFEWKNLDEWTYTHKGDSCDFDNGGYSVSCKTTNRLVIPTASHHGACDMKLRGKVELKLAFGGGNKSWSTNSIFEWDAIMSLTGGAHATGLKVTHSSSHKFSEFSGFLGDFHIVGPRFKDATTLLKEQLDKVTIIDAAIIRELEVTFAGVWPLFYTGAYGYTLCNPIFNSCGDLLFDLQSPLDIQGRVIIGGGSRSDICLPSKNHTISSQIDVAEHFFGGDDSLLTSRTGIDSPLKTPPLDYALTSSTEKIKIREEHEGFDFAGEQEEIINNSTTKVQQRSFEGSDSELEEDGVRGVAAGY